MTTRLWRDISRDDLRMVQYTEFNGQRHVVMPGDAAPVPVARGAMPPDEAIVSIRDPVELLDELINLGYRPTSNAWTAGHVAALEKHIAFAEKVATTLLEQP